MAILYPSNLENILQCPACSEAIQFLIRTKGHHCPKCNKTYPTKAGVLDFFPDYKGAIGRSQRVMEKGWIAKIYERIWRPIFSSFGTRIKYKDEIEWIKEAKPANPPKVIVDLACGSGKYTRLLAEEYPQSLVLGIDLSMPMLQQAKRLASRENITNIVWIRANGQTLPVADNSIAWLNCFGALHLFPNIPKAVKEASRTLENFATFTGMVACEPEGGKIPFFARLALGKSDFQFLSPKTYQNYLQEAQLSNKREKREGLIWLFEFTKQ